MKRAAIVLSRARARPSRARRSTCTSRAYLLDPESPNGLKELARRELGVVKSPSGPRRRGRAPKARGPQPLFDEIDVERAAALAAPDAELPVALRARIEPRLEAERLDALMRDVEVPLEGVLAAMEMRGVLVDVPTLAKIGQKAEEQLRELESACKRIAGRDFVVRSRDQLEKILFDELRLPVVKRTPKGGRSTDADVLEALAEQHELPRRLLEFRELDKLKGTYIDALPAVRRTRRPGASTRDSTRPSRPRGASSSSDPNLQNIPIRTEMGRAIRAAFVAPPGHVILSADYSQIELRVLAHLAQDAELVDAFASGRGRARAHRGARLRQAASDQVSADERRAAKTINFGVIYGMGDSALAKQLGIPREQAARFIAAYFTRYAGVARFMEKSRRGRAPGRGGAHAPRAAALLAEPALGEPRAALRGRARRAQHAHPGNGGRHPEARDDRPRARRRGRRREHGAHGARRARLRGAGGAKRSVRRRRSASAWPAR